MHLWMKLLESRVSIMKLFSVDDDDNVIKLIIRSLIAELMFQ